MSDLIQDAKILKKMRERAERAEAELERLEDEMYSAAHVDRLNELIERLNDRVIELEEDEACLAADVIEKFERRIAELETENEWLREGKRTMHHSRCTRIFGRCNCDEIDAALADTAQETDDG